ncbi:MAG TPA: Rrf2 family transcriptional regulator [Novosphingobium sp.]|nr:Rrf2 family transcriptional regulator [Novosphingobium sp.]
MLSQKTRYTIRALQHLADKFRQGAIRLDAIAEAQNIPRKFLTVILSEMVREGLVISHRGREGGYELALAPCDIRYGDIIRLTRGSLALVPCASRYAHEHCENCLPEADCRLRGLMLAVRDEMATMLDRLTLADAIEVEPPFTEAPFAEPPFTKPEDAGLPSQA